MPFFKPKQPILQNKEISLKALNTSDLLIMKCLRLGFLEKINLCGIYTCIDQAMIIWGVMSGIIFLTAQFLPVSWLTQAIFWSIITVIGVILMTVLTRHWTEEQNISQLLYIWGILMIVGVVITDLAIVDGWGFVLMHLCDFWLIISAIGYIMTGWIVHSRAFFISAIVHLLTVFALPYFMGWQFAVTGMVMMSNLLIFAEKQWDMLLSQDFVKYSSGVSAPVRFRIDRFSPSFSSSILDDFFVLGHIFRHLILFVLT